MKKRGAELAPPGGQGRRFPLPLCNLFKVLKPEGAAAVPLHTRPEWLSGPATPPVAVATASFSINETGSEGLSVVLQKRHMRAHLERLY